MTCPKSQGWLRESRFEHKSLWFQPCVVSMTTCHLHRCENTKKRSWKGGLTYPELLKCFFIVYLSVGIPTQGSMNKQHHTGKGKGSGAQLHPEGLGAPCASSPAFPRLAQFQPHEHLRQKHSRYSPASGPLHSLFPSPEHSFFRYPHGLFLLQISAQLSLITQSSLHYYESLFPPPQTTTSGTDSLPLFLSIVFITCLSSIFLCSHWAIAA